jgi:zinc D-Ala-D-Ala carboxypeptidase
MKNENLTRSFKVSELRCKCGCGRCEMDPKFMEVLQKLRDTVRFPLTITSGFRCDKHNRAVGGASSSMHKIGIAADIDLTSLTEKQRSVLIDAIKLMPEIRGVGVATSFVHIDTRTTKAEWKY